MCHARQFGPMSFVRLCYSNYHYHHHDHHHDHDHDHDRCYLLLLHPGPPPPPPATYYYCILAAPLPPPPPPTLFNLYMFGNPPHPWPGGRRPQTSPLPWTFPPLPSLRQTLPLAQIAAWRLHEVARLKLYAISQSGPSSDSLSDASSMASGIAGSGGMMRTDASQARGNSSGLTQMP